MNNYAEIANLSWDEIQDTKPVPDGTYLLKGNNAVFQPAKQDDQNPVVMFVHTVKEAMDDVKVEELEALGAEYDLTENKVFTRIFIEDGSSWKKVKDILNKSDIETTGKILDDLKKVKGSEVLGFLNTDRFTRRDGTAGENNRVTEWAKVE